MGLINQANKNQYLANEHFSLRLFHPQGKLSAYVQALWSLSVSSNNATDLKRWLQVDACSGILLTLNSAVWLDNKHYDEPVILLPVSKQAHSMTWPPGTQLVGVRFHPGVSFGVFGGLFEEPFSIADSALSRSWQTLINNLLNKPNHFSRILQLYQWLESEIDFENQLSANWRTSLQFMRQPTLAESEKEPAPISQRQLERHFKKLLGMTPKHYQRIVRVKNALNHLRQIPDTNLAELAIEYGFSDQAHMTREFKQFARITPKQYRKLII